MSALEIALLVLYFATIVVLALYGMHRSLLSWRYLRSRNRRWRSKEGAYLPSVTVQLPIYNERAVARRLVEAVAALDYPRDRLEIQVLDDSDDETATIVAEVVARERLRGVRVQHLRRGTRTGYKAGALSYGLERADGELVAVFDADFVPGEDFLRRVVGHFSDDSVGMVQARWGHLNREHSLLTRAQALMLDGHFIIEHCARASSGCFFNFNGTAGVWRRRCIEQAGGWQADTLTEDLDLSYRAQIRGWRFVYLPEVEVPAELPAAMRAFKSQQRRWAKGAIQTARKLLGSVVRSDASRRVKCEAFFHLTAAVSYPLMALLVLLLPTALFIRHERDFFPGIWVELPVLVLATGSVCSFYWLAQRDRMRRSLVELVGLMALGAGTALSNALAVVSAFGGRQTPFERTPKTGMASGQSGAAHGYRARGRWMGVVELIVAAYLGWSVVYAASEGAWAPFPFLLLFFLGNFYVGLSTLWSPRMEAVGSPTS